MAASSHDVPMNGSSHASSRCFRRSARAAGAPGAKRGAGEACVHAGVWLKAVWAAPLPAASLPPPCCLALPVAGDPCPIAAAGPIPPHTGLALESLKSKPLYTPRCTTTGTAEAPVLSSLATQPCRGARRRWWHFHRGRGGGAGPCLRPVATLRQFPHLATVIRPHWPGRGRVQGAGSEIRCYQADAHLDPAGQGRKNAKRGFI